jgi:hypothetical protein
MPAWPLCATGGNRKPAQAADAKGRHCESTFFAPLDRNAIAMPAGWRDRVRGVSVIEAC